jgi:hypothetical protein
LVSYYFSSNSELVKKIRLDKSCKGIASICFSPQKPYKIAILDENPQCHNVWVYDINPKHEYSLAKIETDFREKLDIEWGMNEFKYDEDIDAEIKTSSKWKRDKSKKKKNQPKEDNKVNENDETVEVSSKPTPQTVMKNVIIVTGKKSVKFISFILTDIDEPEINYGVTERKYLYDYTSVWINETGAVFTGTIFGSILKWDIPLNKAHYTGLYEVEKEESAHAKEVTWIRAIPERIISASLDGKIKVFNENLLMLLEFSTERLVMAIDYHNKKLVYTTKCGEIGYYGFDLLEESKKSETVKNAFFGKKKTTSEIKHVGVMSSHFSNEECGLAIEGNIAYTWGDDNQLIVIDYIERKIIDVHEAKPSNSK